VTKQGKKLAAFHIHAETPEDNKAEITVRSEEEKGLSGSARFSETP
jgi:hypothetical protein